MSIVVAVLLWSGIGLLLFRYVMKHTNIDNTRLIWFLIFVCGPMVWVATVTVLILYAFNWLFNDEC